MQGDRQGLNGATTDVLDLLLHEGMPTREHVQAFVDWMGDVANGAAPSTVSLVGRGASLFVRYFSQAMQGADHAPQVLPWSHVTHGADPDRDGTPIGPATFVGPAPVDLCPVAWSRMSDACPVLIGSRHVPHVWPPVDLTLPFELSGTRCVGLRQHLDEGGSKGAP